MSTALRTRTRNRAPSPLVRRRRPAALVGVGTAVVIAVALLSVLLWPHQTSPVTRGPVLEPLPVGAVAPHLQLADSSAQGGSVSLPEPGAVTLVSFLATQPDSVSTPSRSQAVEMVSLATQYSAKGLHVVIVDDSSTAASASALENTGYDWQLGTVPLLADPDHAAAYRYGMASAPATLLIGRDGRVLDRWPGYMLTAQAAQAVTAALAEGPKA